jgi:hypothetical protein
LGLAHAQELRDEKTLSKSRELTPVDKLALKEAIRKLVPRNAEIDEGRSRATILRELFANLRVRAVDLNGDGVPEVIAQPSGTLYWCGATGNCAFWIFQKTRGRFRAILDSHQGNGIISAQIFNMLPTRTHGYNDLVLGAHESASEKELIIYRFNGRVYRPHECFDANWTIIVSDEMRNLKEPQMTPCTR